MTAETAVPTTGVGVVHETGLVTSTETSALVIELGSGFADPTLAAFAPNLLAEITRTRQDLCAALGFILPNISIENVMDSAPTDYRIRVRGITVASATIFPTQIMAINMGNIAAPIGGTLCVDPVFGYPAVWIDAAWAPQAQAFGYALVEPSLVIATHLDKVIRTHATELLNWDMVQRMVLQLSPAYCSLVPGTFSIGTVHQLLCALLSEGVSIRDLAAILEAAWAANDEKLNRAATVALVRERLGLTISAQHRAEDGIIHAVALDAASEARLGQKIADHRLILSEDERTQLVDAVTGQTMQMREHGLVPVLLVSAPVRAAVSALLRPAIEGLSVLSTREIARGMDVTIEGTITLPVV